MGKLHLEVVTPEKVMVSQEVDIVVAPGTMGEFGILEGHVPFLSGIEPGELRFASGNQTERFLVTTGFSEVFDNKVSVLVDAAEKVTEINLERARKAVERARERLAKDRGGEDIDFLRAEAALKRAMVRIRISEKIN
ncbi:MAG: F0F1 ATP synthase subunit epsilon [Deltaproteobacteria bacterium]|jgi:F-type H+-transporting ATPase subunit epsilon|nr:F0F1 ATP synthase subunit epsilon [Deltaproteobacteria bacterium]